MLPYRLKELRKQKGITQEELSKHIGVQRAAISKYESGTIVPSIEIVEKIAKYFTVSIDSLLGYDMDINMYDKIDQILQERGMSRQQLAIEAGIPPTTLQSAFEKKKNMSMEMLLKITVVLEIPITEVLSTGDMWWEKTGERIQKYEEQVAISLNKLTPNEKLRLLASIDKSVDYIARATSDEQERAVNRLSDIIGFYGEMVINGFEMRWASLEQPNKYLVFLRHYEKIIQLANEHKEDIIKSALDFLEDDTKLRDLIYGEDEKK